MKRFLYSNLKSNPKFPERRRRGDRQATINQGSIQIILKNVLLKYKILDNTLYYPGSKFEGRAIGSAYYSLIVQKLEYKSWLSFCSKQETRVTHAFPHRVWTVGTAIVNTHIGQETYILSVDVEMDTMENIVKMVRLLFSSLFDKFSI